MAKTRIASCTAARTSRTVTNGCCAFLGNAIIGFGKLGEQSVKELMAGLVAGSSRDRSTASRRREFSVANVAGRVTSYSIMGTGEYSKRGLIRTGPLYKRGRGMNV